MANISEIIPTEGRLMGLDYGTKRIGVAISTPDQSISSPLDNYTRQNEQLDSKYLCDIVEEYKVAAIVVGLPVHMSGDEGGKAREARQFGEWIAQQTQRPVGYWDERFTSSIADQYLSLANTSRKNRKAQRDMLAAQVMLQAFLDHSQRDQAPSALFDEPTTDNDE